MRILKIKAEPNILNCTQFMFDIQRISYEKVTMKIAKNSNFSFASWYANITPKKKFVWSFANTYPGCQWYKTFYDRNLQMFVINQSVHPWQAFQA